MPYFVVFLEFCPSNSQRKYRDRAATWHSMVGNGHHAEMYLAMQELELKVQEGAYARGGA